MPPPQYTPSPFENSAFHPPPPDPPPYSPLDPLQNMYPSSSSSPHKGGTPSERTSHGSQGQMIYGKQQNNQQVVHSKGYTSTNAANNQQHRGSSGSIGSMGSGGSGGMMSRQTSQAGESPMHNYVVTDLWFVQRYSSSKTSVILITVLTGLGKVFPAHLNLCSDARACFCEQGIICAMIMLWIKHQGFIMHMVIISVITDIHTDVTAQI